MAPKLRPWKPSKNTFQQGEKDRADRLTDPVRIAYNLSHDAARILVYAASKGRTEQKVANGYVARHLVEKGCLSRIPGRASSYRITFRGEAVVEELQKREAMAYLFKERKPPEL